MSLDEINSSRERIERIVATLDNPLRKGRVIGIVDNLGDMMTSDLAAIFYGLPARESVLLNMEILADFKKEVMMMYDSTIKEAIRRGAEVERLK